MDSVAFVGPSVAVVVTVTSEIETFWWRPSAVGALVEFVASTVVFDVAGVTAGDAVAKRKNLFLTYFFVYLKMRKIYHFEHL